MYAEMAVGIISLISELVKYASKLRDTAKQLDEWTPENESAWTKSLVDLSAQDQWKPEDK